ncbi:MAG: iron-containing alcohol dehydrogenase [Phycisphaerales bacterium]|nr:MAG: iron-containing alcohol dehydrogenase [Phycisphaerales bacterium]
MNELCDSVAAILAASPVEVVFGAGALDRVGALAAGLSASRALVVSDPGIDRAGYTRRVEQALTDAGLAVTLFADAAENPTTADVDRALDAARQCEPDLIVGIGGGSVMDCAKGANLLYCNGGRIADYWGEGKATRPNLPMILIPTTAGTGSEAQSFALISDEHTGQKMACGDRRRSDEGGLRPRYAILDPDLTRTQPRNVALAAGIDAIAHAVESAGCTRRNAASLTLSRAAWGLLDVAFPRSIADPTREVPRGAMLLGAHLAGAAIERSMLGAAHACANPLTARFGIAHGVAVGMMLPHVVRYNSANGTNAYAALMEDASLLVRRIEEHLTVTGWPRSLAALGVQEGDLDNLADEASRQWTAQFNPRPVDADAFRALYEAALKAAD